MNKNEIPWLVISALNKVVESFDDTYATVPVVIRKVGDKETYEHLQGADDGSMAYAVEKLKINYLDGTTEYAFCFPGYWDANGTKKKILTVDYCHVEMTEGQLYFCEIIDNDGKWELAGEIWEHDKSWRRYTKVFDKPDGVMQWQWISGSYFEINVNYRMPFKFKSYLADISDIEHEDVNIFSGTVQYYEPGVNPEKCKVTINDIESYPNSLIEVEYRGKTYSKKEELLLVEWEDGSMEVVEFESKMRR